MTKCKCDYKKVEHVYGMVTNKCKCHNCGITVNSYDQHDGWHCDKMTLFRLINKYLHIVKYHVDCIGYSYEHY